MRLEIAILKNLIHHEQYMRKVLPFVKAEYFLEESEKVVFQHTHQFISKYNKPPTLEALSISLENTSLPEGLFQDVVQLVSKLEPTENSDLQWLTDETEKFCKDKAVYNAIIRSIGIMEGRDKQVTKDGIPSLLQEALGVCFDRSVGHDYFDNSDDRYDLSK